ncbi:hypothetical protein L2E82_45139 [Cichorium intybus]|uniref:Uncharacterized protein n=1 Tax=Cichorium intybus TaxID=13427 RepID=A0ACB8ZT55_CICIN|nr:hypothetical protein L2E82_45139 [Cichorium intybus]
MVVVGRSSSPKKLFAGAPEIDGDESSREKRATTNTLFRTGFNLQETGFPILGPGTGKMKSHVVPKYAYAMPFNL